jgi:hypothetical protein
VGEHHSQRVASAIPWIDPLAFPAVEGWLP